MLFQTYRFTKKDGTFDSAPFLKLLEKSRRAMKSGKKSSAFLAKSNASKAILIGGIPKKEIWAFINKLANFLTSGIDIKTALGIAEKQIHNAKLRLIVGEMRSNLNYGLSLSDTLKQFKKYFDPMIIALVEVGEKTGSLPRVLTELEATLLESIEIKAKIKGAMIYPVILVTLAISMVIFMLTFVLPKVTDSFIKSDVPIPGLTQAVMNISSFLIGHGVLLFFLLIVSVVGGYFLSKTRVGQLFFHYIKLKIPVFGHIEKQNNIIFFINSLSLLLNSGVLMLEALETTANIVPNIYYKRDVIRIKNEVETGIKLSNAMGLTVGNNKDFIFINSLFSEELVHMVSVGEETGTISKNIQKVGINYTKELKRYIANLMTALEPFIIVFIGALIGTIIIAIMLPFFSLTKVVQKL
ncbi:MAG: type II secretion system F family protein [Candidatus Gracilibacteria bacterium]|nr:type II secretion system F family protein [Candidatus Gracilibacteria bacterium]